MLKLSSLNITVASSVALVMVTVLAGIYLPSHISITMTPSLNHRIYFIEKEFASVGKGDYVLFNFSSSYIEGGKVVKATKRIGCAEGDYLHVVMGDYYCGNDYLGRAKEKALNGSSLPRFEYVGTVPHGKVFVVGDSKDSFDSRYWGFLDKGKIIAKAYPIW